MVITIKYSTGQTFKIIGSKDALKNTVVCVLDDVSTKVKEQIA